MFNDVATKIIPRGTIFDKKCYTIAIRSDYYEVI